MANVGNRQTLARAVEVETRHVRQAGGRGEFAVVVMRFEPLLPPEVAAWGERSRVEGWGPDPDGLYFDDQSRGALPRECVPAVEQGFREAAACGVASPLPFVHVLATLLGGKFHDVGNPCRGFPMAAALCFREAQARAGVVPCEPVMRLTVEVPEAAVEHVEAEILRRRGVVVDFGPGSQLGWAVVCADVPEAEAPTGDLGGFPASVTFNHFAPVELPSPGGKCP